MTDLTTAVRKEIGRLRDNIATQTAVLRKLTNELEKHEKVAAMLGTGTAPRKAVRRAKPKKGRKASKRTNWNALLEGLPRSFTAAQVKSAAGDASNQADVHQALLRWRKAGRIATSARGKYRKSAAGSS